MPNNIVYEGERWRVTAEWGTPGDWANANNAVVQAQTAVRLSLRVHGTEVWNRQPLKSERRAHELADAFVNAGFHKVNIYKTYERVERTNIK